MLQNSLRLKFNPSLKPYTFALIVISVSWMLRDLCRVVWLRINILRFIERRPIFYEHFVQMLSVLVQISSEYLNGKVKAQAT